MTFFKKIKKDIGLEEQPQVPKVEIQDTPQETPSPKNLKVKDGKQKVKPEEKNEQKEELNPKKGELGDWIKTKGQLAVDVYQTDSEFCVQSPIAGVEPGNLSITAENEMLIIKGERQEPDKDKEKEYFYQECYWGPFSRQIILPEDVDINNVKASLKKGVLIVRIPRVKMENKKIAIELED